MCKPNEKHWEVIFNYFDIYPDIPTGRINAGNGKRKMKQLWEELSQQLNSLGYGTKSPDKWQKTWIDFKYNLKKKASDIKKDQVKTGGGPGVGKVLNEIELRALEFLGKGFVHGVGSSEVGLKRKMNETLRETEEDACRSISTEEDASTSLLNLPSASCNTNYYLEEPLRNHVSLEYNTVGPVNVNKADACTFAASIGKPTKASITTIMPKQKSNKTSIGQVQLDHSYISSHDKNKKIKHDGYDNMYAETISALKNINQTVDRRLGQIYEVLLERLPRT